MTAWGRAGCASAHGHAGPAGACDAWRQLGVDVGIGNRVGAKVSNLDAVDGSGAGHDRASGRDHADIQIRVRVRAGASSKVTDATTAVGVRVAAAAIVGQTDGSKATGLAALGLSGGRRTLHAAARRGIADVASGAVCRRGASAACRCERAVALGGQRRTLHIARAVDRDAGWDVGGCAVASEPSASALDVLRKRFLALGADDALVVEATRDGAADLREQLDGRRFTDGNSATQYGSSAGANAHGDGASICIVVDLVIAGLVGLRPGIGSIDDLDGARHVGKLRRQRVAKDGVDRSIAAVVQHFHRVADRVSGHDRLIGAAHVNVGLGAVGKDREQR